MMLKKVFLIIAAISTTLVAQDNKIAIGPYIQQMGSNSAKICWSTFIGNTTITDPDGKTIDNREYHHHSIQLGRLESNTLYKYDVLNDGSEEGKGQFRTYPDEIEPFKFVVLGDTRSRHDVHTKIVNRIIEQEPMFVINTGDLVSNGRVIGDWEQFFKINREMMRNTPYYPVLGNHEKDSPYYYDFFDLPNNERYYYFNVGDALFIVLDSEGEEVSEPLYVSDENSDQFWKAKFEDYFVTQKAWLEKVLTLHKEAGFIFVFQHKPLYGVKKSRLEEVEQNRKFYGDIFERHRVQVFMNGHDHHYHHAISNGVHYITTAGGGAGLYDVDAPQPETVKYNKIEHFILTEINHDDAVLNVIDIDGNEIDKITVEKRTAK